MLELKGLVWEKRSDHSLLLRGIVPDHGEGRGTKRERAHSITHTQELRAQPESP